MTKRIKLIKLIVLTMLCLTSIVSYAGCGYGGSSKTGYKSFYISSGTVYVQRDLAVGSVIQNYTISQNFDPQFGCSTAWTLYYRLGLFSSSTGYSGTYATNVPGVGVKVYDSYYGATFPYNYSANGNYYMAYDTYTVSLVKTGAISAGMISSGKLIVSGISGSGDYFDISIPSGVYIVPVACSITTPNLTFPIGDILVSKFGTAIGTIPTGGQNTQNLGLNCDYNANINVSLSGIQNPDIGTTSVLALTNQGDADVAKGVGVQILYNGTVLSRDSRIVLKRSSGGQEMLPITARYYQTKTSVTTGRANATATLNLTYQ